VPSIVADTSLLSRAAIVFNQPCVSFEIASMCE
jgi:hypothetical protein